jgi:hypothetical protein
MARASHDAHEHPNISLQGAHAKDAESEYREAPVDTDIHSDAAGKDAKGPSSSWVSTQVAPAGLSMPVWRYRAHVVLEELEPGPWQARNVDVVSVAYEVVMLALMMPELGTNQL